MKRFIYNNILFLSPIIAVSGTIFYLLIIYGEFLINPENIISQGNYEIIGQKYSDSNTLWIKIESSKKKAPKIIALGSSRVLQFRECMFNQGFYNFGYTTTTNSSILPTLKLISQNKKPEFLIIALDQWSFNPRWDPTNYPNYIKVKPELKQNFSVRDIINFFVELSELEKPLNIPPGFIGINAVKYGSGFRKDGSMDYGVNIAKKLANDSTFYDFNFKNTLARATLGTDRFAFGDSIDDSELLYIQDLVDYCESNSIKLVFFLPPFAPSVYSEMKSSGNFKYIEDLDKKLAEFSKAKNVSYFNFSSPGLISYTDKEMIDGFHASEVVHVKMLEYMIKCDTSLLDYINPH